MPIILYLTTDCNLDCEYCYEAISRKKISSAQELDFITVEKQLDEEFKSKTNDNCVVLFGGEPLLKFDLIEQLLWLNKNKYSNYFSFSLTTNGLLLNENKINILKEYSKTTMISISISYDGLISDRRRYNNMLSAKKDIEEKIYLLEKSNYYFGISYTIHKDNAEINTIINDFVYMFENFKYLNKIEISYYTQELDNIYGDSVLFISELMDKLLEVYNKYNISMCCMKYYSNNISEICTLCKKCVKTENNTYLSGNKNLIQIMYENNGDFVTWT